MLSFVLKASWIDFNGESVNRAIPRKLMDATGFISMLELLSTLFFILICADLIFGGLSGRSRRPPGDEPGDDI